MASIFQKFLGLKLYEDVQLEQIKDSCGSIESRVVYPDSVMTMDYIPDRVNIFVLSDNTIVDINMG